ncbi:hypothetical protein [Staphylococcus edaphicus]|uniref:Uncharacterized protein n=1 Tax=Staphylococcus edaphicus TaxID=1955013 RepID=A0A2C6WSQ1_9STAP|nr:hypothetical protein [Staphylococcus edaphicus]PHK50776.1 hypothetical protein BTJ66_00280 [Staphylococcus edaphicus]UQW82468.1 hypothetical protein MNY58_05230 [Staphylococcus edaphicus]
MKTNQYKDAWQELKEKKIEKFTKLHSLIINHHEDEGDYLRYIEQKNELLDMDNADNTNGFSNLLSDMEDE